jgi:hypothetical protein
LWSRRRGFDDGRQGSTERVGHGVVDGGRGAGVDRDAVIDRFREMRSIHVTRARSFVRIVDTRSRDDPTLLPRGARVRVRVSWSSNLFPSTPCSLPTEKEIQVIRDQA